MLKKLIFLLSVLFFCISLSFSYTFDFVNYEEIIETEGNFTIESEGVDYFKFYVNGNYERQYDFNTENEDIVLGEEEQDYSVFVGEPFEIVNDRINEIIRIEISEINLDESLSYGGSIPITIDEIGDYSYKIYEEDDTFIYEGTISVINSNFTTIIENVSEFLESGDNLVLFEVFFSNNGNIEQEDFEYEINFNKYPNTLTIDDSFAEKYNSRDIEITGTTRYEHDLYYDVNVEEVFSTTRLIKANETEFSNKRFNLTLPVRDIVEGENFVRFVTTSPDNSNIKTQDKKVTFIIDTTPPSIEFDSAYFSTNESSYFQASNTLLVNEDSINLKFLVDSELDTYFYSLNNETSSNFTKNPSDTIVEIALSNLEKGENDFFITGFDELGNTNTLIFPINLDDEKPEVIEEELLPKHIFEGEGATLQFERISGKVTKPNTNLFVFAIDTNYKIDDKRVSCDDYMFLFDENLLDYANGFNTLDLLGGIDGRMLETQTDDEGKFSGLIGFDVQTLDEESSSTDDTIELKTENSVCFLMADVFGNVEIYSKQVDIILGNPNWVIKDVRTIPNTLYSAEIEQSAGSTGNQYEEATIISRFDYIGQYDIESISLVDIELREFTGNGFEEIVKDKNDDDTATVGGEYGNFIIPPTGKEVSYRYTISEGVLEVVFPIKFKSLGVDPSSYPDSMAVTFKMYIKHKLEDGIPGDSTNPIYFSASFNVERPIDLIGEGSLLSPKNINATQRFLNKSIGFTQRATTYLRYGSLIGLGACLGAKIWHMFSLKTAMDDTQKDELNRALFRICDRVACQISPSDCGDSASDNLFEDGFNLNDIENSKGDLTDNLDFGNLRIQNQEGLVLGEITEARALGSCEKKNESGGTVDGIYVQFRGDTYDQQNLLGSRMGVTNIVQESFSTQSNMCYTQEEIKNLNPKTMGLGVCFTTEAPYYDDTKAWWPGMGINGFRDNNPKDGIFWSVRGACITDTYSHTNNFLKLQKDIYQCLEQAKIGQVRGGYCQRLMAQAVCDIATNVLVPAVKEGLTSRGGGRGEDFAQSVRESNEIFQNRYQNSIFDNNGNLGTTNLYHKTCISALTGDLSLLTDDFLLAIESNEVDPIFGPPLPESRIIGYNPLTGELTTQYRWTQGAVSGGSEINIEYELICDKNSPNGEYCPSNYEVKKLDRPKGYVRKGASTSENMLVKDEGARYWYNILKVTWTYSINDVQKTSTDTFNIIHKSEVPAECSFSTGISTSATAGSQAGFSCDLFYSQGSQISRFTILDETDFIPKSTGKKIYYNGDTINVDLVLDVKDEGDENKLDLHYGARCEDVSTTDVGPEIYPIVFDDLESLNDGIINREVSFDDIEIDKILGINEYRTFELKKIKGCSGSKCGPEKDSFIIQTDIDLEDVLNVYVKEDTAYETSRSITKIPKINIPNNPENYFYYQIEDLKPEEKFDKITFKLKDPDSEILFNIYSYDEDFKPVNELQEDTKIEIEEIDKTERNFRDCELYLRVLPYDLEEKFSTIDALINYSLEEEEDVLQSEDIQTSNFKKLDFEIREIEEDDLIDLSVEKPKNEFSFTKGENISIQIYTNRNLSDKDFTFKFSLNNKVYGDTLSKDLVISNFTYNHPKYTYNIESEDYKDLLDKDIESFQEFTFKYILTYKENEREKTRDGEVTIYGSNKKK